ncbi:MAG: hypothetical protein D6775_07200, partial [Caldilineae bacterium]
MKHLRLSVLLVVLALLLTACAGGATPQPTQAPAPTEAPAAAPAEEVAMYGDLRVIDVEPGATIVFSGWGDETEQKIYRDSIERFKKFYPDVTVD